MTFIYIHGDKRTSPVPVTMVWSPKDPFEVELRLPHVHRGVVSWVVARDLLADGVHFASGIGDVRLQPDEDDPRSLRLTLESPSGRAELLVSAHTLGAFLAETFAVVPAGAEVLDFSWLEHVA